MPIPFITTRALALFLAGSLVPVGSLRAGSANLPEPASISKMTAPLHVKRSELHRQSLPAEGLSLTVEELIPKESAATALPLVGGLVPRRKIQLKVENLSGDSRIFRPELFILVGRDGKQAMLAREDNGRREEHWDGARAASVAPGAHFQRAFTLTDDVQLPAMVFYRGTPLVEVTP